MTHCYGYKLRTPSTNVSGAEYKLIVLDRLKVHAVQNRKFHRYKGNEVPMPTSSTDLWLTFPETFCAHKTWQLCMLFLLYNTQMRAYTPVTVCISNVPWSTFFQVSMGSPCTDDQNVSSQSPADGHLHCFQSSAVANNAQWRTLFTEGIRCLFT